ncbi:hypothetical protein BWK58_06310 [Flavobacterium columnare]|nr:hypothetical protein BWK58_06310 [Flavobacterium columnare]
MQDIVSNIFKENPKLDEIFTTADGNAFYLIGDAKNHAKSLEDDKVKKHLRNNSFQKKVNDTAKEIKPAKAEKQQKAKQETVKPEQKDVQATDEKQRTTSPELFEGAETTGSTEKKEGTEGKEEVKTEYDNKDKK